MYAKVYQESGNNQGLVTAKARLAKKGLTIPRPKIVAAHMAANVVDNARNALEGCAVRSEYGWTDSMVALHQIASKGTTNSSYQIEWPRSMPRITSSGAM